MARGALMDKFYLLVLRYALKLDNNSSYYRRFIRGMSEEEIELAKAIAPIIRKKLIADKHCPFCGARISKIGRYRNRFISTKKAYYLHLVVKHSNEVTKMIDATVRMYKNKVKSNE